MRQLKHRFLSAGFFFAFIFFLVDISTCVAQPETGKKRNPKPKTLQYKRWLLTPGIGGHLADSTTVIAIGCYTRFNVLRSFSDFSVSVASPVHVGYNLISSSPYFEVPILTEANLGHLSTKNSFSRLGFSFGAGYNFFMLSDKFCSGMAATFCFRWFMAGQSFSFRLLSTFAGKDNVPFLGAVYLGISPGEWRKKNRDLNKVSRFSAPYRKK